MMRPTGFVRVRNCAGFVWFASLLMAAAVTASGCDKSKKPEKPKNIPESVEFKVDAEGVYYRYREPDGTMTSAQSLAQIPLAARPAVAVHVTGETPTSDEAGGYYVANLLQADSGDTVTANKRKPVWLNRAGRATDRAARIALGLRQELTPDPKPNKKGGMDDHELRDRQIDITEIKGSAREANLFNEVADAGSTGEKVDRVKKIIGSDRQPGPRRTDGRPAPQHAPETDQPALQPSDDQQPTTAGGQESSSGSNDRPSREEINRQLEKARESGRMPEGAERRIQQQRQ